MYIICSRRLSLGLTVPLWHHRETALGGTERKKRFYPGRIQWPGQKNRLVKSQAAWASGTLDIHPLETLMPAHVFILSRHQVSYTGKAQTQCCAFISVKCRKERDAFWELSICLQHKFVLYLSPDVWGNTQNAQIREYQQVIKATGWETALHEMRTMRKKRFGLCQSQHLAFWASGVDCVDCVADAHQNIQHLFVSVCEGFHIVWIYTGFTLTMTRINRGSGGALGICLFSKKTKETTENKSSQLVLFGLSQLQ